MDVGVQFLREHIIPEARVHYAITNADGVSPNVVQAEAEVLYLIRAPKNPQVQEICERVHDIARGAALMTGTVVDIQLVKGCSNVMPNTVLESTLPEPAGGETTGLHRRRACICKAHAQDHHPQRKIQ